MSTSSAELPLRLFQFVLYATAALAHMVECRNSNFVAENQQVEYIERNGGRWMKVKRGSGHRHHAN